jgi:hypothetical protein
VISLALTMLVQSTLSLAIAALVIARGEHPERLTLVSTG